MRPKTSSKRFKNWLKPDIQDGIPTEWNWIVRHPESLKMGKNVDIGTFTYINARYGVEIEDDVQIGGGCKIYSYSTIDDKWGKIILRKNCRIGANSVVMPGITIGRNAIVGALSFVNKNIPSNQIWAGSPIKRIK